MLAIADQTVGEGETETKLPAFTPAGDESVGATKVAIATKAGLTYKLPAGTLLGEVANVCDRAVGTGSPLGLENGAPDQPKFVPTDPTAVFFKAMVAK